MSVGRRSGVNCILLNSQPVTRARLRIVRVFATPGIPSTSTCPFAMSASSRLVTISSCPITIFFSSSRSFVNRSW